jgi:nitrogen-specific signal transduction histidine kinase
MGLDIVRRLVFNQKGDIEVESQPGHTVFRVILPVAVSVTRAATVAAPATAPVA